MRSRLIWYVIFLYHVCESRVRNLSNEQYPDMIYAYHLIINMFNPLPLHNIPACVIWLVLAAFLDFSFFLYVSSLGPKQAQYICNSCYFFLGKSVYTLYMEPRFISTWLLIMINLSAHSHISEATVLSHFCFSARNVDIYTFSIRFRWYTRSAGFYLIS